MNAEPVNREDWLEAARRIQKGRSGKKRLLAVISLPWEDAMELVAEVALGPKQVRPEFADLYPRFIEDLEKSA